MVFAVLLAFAASIMPGATSGIFGIHGIGTWDNKTTFNNFASKGFVPRGFHIYVSWDELEPSEGVYNWSMVDNQIYGMRAKGIYSGLQFLVGRNAPQWLMTRCGTFLTNNTSVQNFGPYPCYFEPQCSYNSSVTKLVQATADWFENTWGSVGKSQILYWHLSEGTTGDEFAYHGDPSSDGVDTTKPPCGRWNYSISKATTWFEFRRYLWRVGAEANMKNVAWLKLLMNPSSNFADLDDLWAISPTAYTKDGKLSHQYGFDSEAATFNRVLVTQFDEFTSRRERGEFQDTYLLTEWQYAPIKNTWALFHSALTGQLDMLQYGLSLFKDNTPDTRPLYFYDKYAPFRNPAADATTRGFVSFRNVIDVADVIRFPETEYGVLIDPARMQLYSKALQNASVTAGPLYYPMRVSVLTETYINPARVKKIKDAYLLPTGQFYFIGALDATATNENNMTFGDFGINMSSTRNYGKFVTQLNIDGSSYGRFRCGSGATLASIKASDGEMHGRYCCEFNLSATPELLLKVDQGLQCFPGAANNVWINLTYYDDTTAGSFQVFYASSQGKKQAGAVVSKSVGGTKQWNTVTYNLADFEFGGKLAGGADFTIKYLTGTNTQFSLVEFENMSKANALTGGPACGATATTSTGNILITTSSATSAPLTVSTLISASIGATTTTGAIPTMTSAPVTTMTVSCSVPPLPVQPLVPCTISCCTNSSFKLLLFNVSTDLPLFDCPRFSQNLSSAFGIPGSRFNFCWLAQGSTIATIEFNIGDAQMVLEKTPAVSISALRSVTDPSTGTTITANNNESGSNITIIIVGAVVGGVVLIAIVVLMVALIARYQRHSKFHHHRFDGSSASYVPM